MASEFIAGLSLFKTAFDIAKGLKDVNDATIRNGAVIELQEAILTAQQQQSTLIERVRELETEVARLKAWDREKEQYELKQVEPGALAYLPKKDTEAAKQPHWLCANCFEEGKKSHMQNSGNPGKDRMGLRYECAGCKTSFITRGGVYPGQEGMPFFT